MTMAGDDKLRLWTAFEKTDPNHTKPVTFGRKFTSIDAQWQLWLVTSVLGPVGEGWRYTVEHSIERIAPELTIAIADVTISWGLPLLRRTSDSTQEVVHQHVYGPVRGMVELWSQKTSHGKPVVDAEGRPVMMFDDDAGKKAMTDALTKALSHLGVSADVFMGRFDDNKYVEKMKAEFNAKTLASQPVPEDVQQALRSLAQATTLEDIENAVGLIRPIAASWAQHHVDLYAMRLRERRAQLTAAE
jgi:hypothetical protein